VSDQRTGLIRDLTDDEARAALPQKWGAVDADVLPAWVAEMDYAPPDPVVAALHRAVAVGQLGYPGHAAGVDLAMAYAGFAERHYGQPDLVRVIPVVDVTAGLRFVLDVLSEPAPMIVPIPAYGPHHHIAQITGRERVDMVLDPDAPQAELDIDRIDHLLRAGARTLLLTQPHNPWGRVFTRGELESVRDVVCRHRARVISDEVHAPLTLPGATHVSYLAVEGTSDHAVALVSASKAFNIAGLRCAQIVTTDGATMGRLLKAPVALNDSWSTLAAVASTAAYSECDEWLGALTARLDAQRTLLAALLTSHLPEAKMRPLEGTYLAWIDLRSYGHEDVAAVALERGRVMVSPGHEFQPGLPGHIRLNVATSPERLTEIIRRLAGALA
jgi:cystathionine beta-lyase